MENQQLLPDLIKDIILKYNESKKDPRKYNETISIQMRLEVIRDAVQDALSSNEISMSMRLRRK